jgi:hypothetical protein
LSSHAIPAPTLKPASTLACSPNSARIETFLENVRLWVITTGTGTTPIGSVNVMFGSGT